MGRLTEAQARALRFAAGQGGGILLVQPVTEDRLLRRGLIAFDGLGSVTATKKGRSALSTAQRGAEDGGGHG